MSLSEFALIERYFAHLTESITAACPYIDLSIGDDCSLFSIPEDKQLAQSIDTLNANIHFPAEANPQLIAQRALAVTVSDLAAMGATPFAFSLAITMPELNEKWLQAFSRGLQKAAQHYGVALIGGDTTKGPLSMTLLVSGVVEKGRAIQRSGAIVGDIIFVTGSLGDAAAALAYMQGKLDIAATEQAFFKQRYYQPVARINVGQSLHELATAAIDISDGLLADLGHILTRSNVAAEINVAALPLSSALKYSCSHEQALSFALSGGDDYELCFTVPPHKLAEVTELAELMDVPMTNIGSIVAGAGVCCLDAEGKLMKAPSNAGYQHF